MKIKVNKRDKLFVIPCGGGFSCLGFEVLDRKARALAAELGAPWAERIGTLKAYKKYNTLQNLARKIHQETGRRFDCELSRQLMGLEGRRVEVMTMYGEIRRFTVGKSTGFIPCHLEVCRASASGGPAAEKEYKTVRVVY
jgi:hypothetical protein